MKWNIRNQILIPIVVTTALGIVVSTYFNILGLIENENQRVQTKVDDLFETLSETSFPLNESVLVQVHQISGFHLFVKQDSQIRSSFTDKSESEQSSAFQNAQDPADSEITIFDKEFLVFEHQVSARNLSIYALYPREEFRNATRKVIYPQLLSGLVILAVVGFIVVIVARNVTSPIQSLKEHVGQIAEGKFVQENSDRSDEIGELFQSINEMASKLQIYEQRIRAQEKLLTLDQMGGGIAHQMRNSITGCRLALDFHKQTCQGDDESLEVANRQLIFMEDFQKRFLSFSKESSREMETVDLGNIVSDYAKLLEPFAKHVQVQFEVIVPDKGLLIDGNESMLQQLVGNLATNAIEAASTHQESKIKSVTIKVEELDSNYNLSVTDSGAGIMPDVAKNLFDPLVTTKPDGVGLGLAIVKQTVDEHRAEISWSRENNKTTFLVRFPQGHSKQSTARAETEKG